MQIVLTFDYELFFGTNSGSVEKCMIEPTNRLFQLADEYAVKLVFFVDIGYYIQMHRYENASLVKDKLMFENQVKEMVSRGHDVQLHIHPHWEKAVYQENGWIFNMDKCYKLDDFSDVEIDRIVRLYKDTLDQLTGQKSTSYRAGGWCIQPFHRLEKLFKELNIQLDSSVFSGAKYETDQYNFDFTTAPKKDFYRFQEDVTKEVKNGSFIEIPITSYRYSPLFYWRLYVLGRLFPKQHKMLGDGTFLSQPGRKKSVLTNFTWNHASCDGYYASKLNQIVASKSNNQYLVVIAHPKGMTNYSFKALGTFIQIQKSKHSFATFREILEENK